jgi:hypothetical protein
MGINLKKKPGRPKKVQSTEPIEEKLNEREVYQLEVISKQLNEIEYLREALASARNGEEYYLQLFDNQAKEAEELRQMIKNVVAQMKNAFRMGLRETGEITIQDVDYNLDLIVRFMEHKFFKETAE